uniref:Ig-like domain-containing protein n=1 Tax=Junco hyemalis TaxID=40217 RepID=A0A8C5J925_JUNHY
ACLLWDSSQKHVITYSGGRVYDDLNEEQKGRVSFTSNFLAGDASLQIISLQSSDAGKYICKVKNAGQYEWARITLKVVAQHWVLELSFKSAFVFSATGRA